MTLPAFGSMLLEQGVEAEVLGDPPEGRHGAEVADQRGRGLAGLLEAPEEVVGLTEVGQDDGPGFAVDASGLHDLPIGMTADRLGHQARHEFSVYKQRDESRDRADFAENTEKNCWPEGKWTIANLVYTIRRSQPQVARWVTSRGIANSVNYR
jgi:hypothetical protein